MENSAPYRGALWAQFCDELKALGQEVLRSESPTDDFNRAEGYRYLTRMLRDGLMRKVEYSDPYFPVLYDFAAYKVSIGNNPDNDYFMSFIDGNLDYRLSGKRNTVHYICISTKSGNYETDGKLAPAGFIDTTTLKCDADGGFEIILSQKPQPGNWLEMNPRTTNLIVRQTYLDRANEVGAGEMKLECINRPDAPSQINPATYPGQLLSVIKYIQGNLNVTGDWTRSFQTRPNSFYPMDQSVYLNAGGDPSIYYEQGYWELKADEALFVTVPPKDCEFWNFQINNYWSEVVGMDQAPSARNKFNAKADADGSVTLVVAHRDPGHPNWIPTLGHDRGSLIFRIINCKDPETPRMEMRRI